MQFLLQIHLFHFHPFQISNCTCFNPLAMNASGTDFSQAICACPFLAILVLTIQIRPVQLSLVNVLLFLTVPLV